MRDGEFCLKRPVGEIANRPFAILYLLSEPAGASATKRAYRFSFPLRSAPIHGSLRSSGELSGELSGLIRSVKT